MKIAKKCPLCLTKHSVHFSRKYNIKLPLKLLIFCNKASLILLVARVTKKCSWHWKVVAQQTGGSTKSRAKQGRGTKLRGQALFWRWNLGGETKHVTIVIEEVFSTDNDEDDVDFFKWWWLWGRNLHGDKTCHNSDWKRCLSRLSLIYQHHLLARDIWECKGGSNKDKKRKWKKSTMTSLHICIFDLFGQGYWIQKRIVSMVPQAQS